MPFREQAQHPGLLRVREARLGDVEEMVDLLRQLFALEPDFPFNADRQRKGLVQLLCREQGAYALVAEMNARVVGMGTVQTVVSTAEGGSVGWVEDLVVEPAFRGKGIGKLLLLTLEQWAAAQGLLRLQLLADRDNGAALDFYSRQNWGRTSLLALRKRL